MNIKSILRKTAYGYKAESSSYIEHLRSIGMKIGSDCIIYVPTKTLIDEQYPWMITIGDHVRITEGVKILTHDYSWSVLKNCRGGNPWSLWCCRNRKQCIYLYESNYRMNCETRR